MDNNFFDILNTITALDGRNRHKLIALFPYLSDFALNKYRIYIECEYFKKLFQFKIIRKLTVKEVELIDQLYNSFNEKDYKRIREIEKKTNHDVKAVEEFIKEKLNKTSLKDIVEMIHFGLTSEDINNLAYALMIKNVQDEVIIPELNKISKALNKKTQQYKNIPLLSRTHGQPAVPTTLGKEILVYCKKLDEEIKILKNLEIRGKLTGNVGNLNVHKFIYPNIDWLNFSKEFVISFGLKPDIFTTQIEPYDSLIFLFQTLSRINNILIGLCADFWLYISFGYFKQKIIKAEVGSTALPHKVNPIYFEGAEGGFGIANSLFEFYARKLSYSRLQRDLSDATVRRSFSIAFGYSLLSYQSINEALSRIEPNYQKISEELNLHWEILSEAVQNLLRVKGYHQAYDKTKEFFRGKTIRKGEYEKFVIGLKLKSEDEDKLLNLSPEKYIGYAEEIINKYLKNQFSTKIQ